MRPAGALWAVLLRHVREGERLLNNLDQPLIVLASFAQRALESDYCLRELVREADVEWGRVNGAAVFPKGRMSTGSGKPLHR